VIEQISSHLPDLINQYISTRAQRMEKDKEVASFKELEDTLKDAIIAKYKEQGIKQLGAANGVVKMTTSLEPVTHNWPTVWAYIRETGEFELLHKRLASLAIRERWDAGIELPGIDKQELYKLSVSGAKS
jgi:hypothetical protein